MLLAISFYCVYPILLFPFAKYAPTFKVLSFSSSFFFFSYIFQEQLKFDAFITHSQSSVFFIGFWSTSTLPTINRFALTDRTPSQMIIEIYAYKYTIFLVFSSLYWFSFMLSFSIFRQRAIANLKFIILFKYIFE